MDRYHDIRQIIAGPIELRSHAHSDNTLSPIEYAQFYIKYCALIQDSHYMLMYEYVAFHMKCCRDQEYQLNWHT